MIVGSIIQCFNPAAQYGTGALRGVDLCCLFGAINHIPIQMAHWLGTRGMRRALEKSVDQ